ncbi:uncharacterized protein LOC106070978 isoform X2 [Biomphalaria glabrata]|uniref:Uncharacterized protein LOC106070978 isoform X2 n=1 Tax=Biomphalaria glabrata TaxID=6526 RepID=A0A9W3AK49_BIOGL|nr:uncharacterized protein LOC106070978 isoform X2 [Biomphalaria glabrata]
MRSLVLLTLLLGACAAQSWNVESYSGPQYQSYQYSYSQCFGLARRSRQTKVEIPTLYNTKTRQSAPVPQALYSADRSVIAKLEGEGWVVRTQRTLVPQFVYERVPVCCPWEQSCDQRQTNQVDQISQDSNAPCANGGQLIYKDGQQVCQCPSGYQGLWCQTPVTSSKVEHTPNFPKGSIIRLTTTSGPYLDQALNEADILKRQQFPIVPMNGRMPVPRDAAPLTPYNQQAALWHQQALRARLAQLQDLYVRSRGYPIRHTPCVSCRRMKPVVSLPAPGVPRPYFARQFQAPYLLSRANKPYPQARLDKPYPQIRLDKTYPQIRMDKPYPQIRLDKSYPRGLNLYTSPRPVMIARNPYSSLTSSGQLPPRMMEAAQAIQQDLQQRESNPYSVPSGRRYGNPYNSLPQQTPMYLPPQGARVPEARTPWDLDPFNQQQNPFGQQQNSGYMSDPRASENYNRERQLLAMAVFKQLMDQQRARMAVSSPVLRAQKPTLEQTQTTTPEAVKVPEPPKNEVPKEMPLMPTPEEMVQMRECHSVLEPKIKACFASQDMSIEQFMNPEFIQKSSKLCQNNAVLIQCIQQLGDVCVEKSAQISKKVLDSVLRTVGMVCQQIASRVGTQPVPAPQTQQTQDQVSQSSGSTESPNQAQAPEESQDDQTMPSLEEQQQMRQCQGILEPALNECVKSYEITLDQFMNPNFMNKARAVCQDSTNVAMCIKKLDSTCGASNVKTTKKMLNSILGMMGMVCQQIQVEGGVQANKDFQQTSKEPVQLPVQEQTMTQTNQQKPGLMPPPPQQAQDPADSQQEMPTPEEIRIIQQCQPVLEPGLNECLKNYDLTVQQFASPQFMDKAQNVCLNSNAVGECVRKLENSCGEPVVIRKMLMSLMRMMTMVCQQIQTRGGEKSQPAEANNQTPGRTLPGLPTEETLQHLQQCQPVLHTKINECLKSYDLTLQQFNEPQYVEKSSKICQDGPAVSSCIKQLDKACGEDFVLSTGRIIKSVLGTMGMICGQIQSREQEQAPRSHRGPLLRSGPPTLNKNLNENPAPVASENKHESPSQTDNLPTNSDNVVEGEQPTQGLAAKQSSGGEQVVKYMSRDLELFGYPLWLIITLILILAVLLLLFVMVVCLCLRRKKKQRKVVITKDACEKPPLPEETLCTIGIPPPSYTITPIQQNEDGLTLPPIDIGEDSVSVSLDDSATEKPPLKDTDNKTGKY